MAMNKIERIDREIAKTREKITEYQNKLRGLEMLWSSFFVTLRAKKILL